MKERTWTIAVLASTCAVAGSSVAIDYACNLYGLYRNAEGRRLSVYFNQRTTKFLFGMNYIPTNFTGIFLGSSITENWDTSQIDGARVYNAAVAGGNISEELLIAHNVFSRRRMRLVMITILPFETASHGRKSGAMVPSEYWGGLGSIGLFGAYALFGAEHLFGYIPNSDPNGVTLHSTAFANRRIDSTPPIHVDQLGFADLLTLIREAHASADRVVAVIPPYSWTIWQVQHRPLRVYARDVLRYFNPADTVVDFTRDQYEDFARDATNFPDGAHISSKAAKYLMGEVNRILSSDSAPTAGAYVASADGS